MAVFREMDVRVSRFTIYVSGLSGERMTKRNPLYVAARAGSGKKAAAGTGDAGEENPKYFVLRKTLALPYTLPGDARTRRSATPALGRMTWVMR